MKGFSDAEFLVKKTSSVVDEYIDEVERFEKVFDKAVINKDYPELINQGYKTFRKIAELKGEAKGYRHALAAEINAYITREDTENKEG